MNGDLETFHGALESKGATKAIVSFSCISSLHTDDIVLNSKTESAALDNIFSQYPFSREGQMNTCLDLGNTCMTSHICLTAIFASAGGGAQTHEPSGSVNTLWNQSVVVVKCH